MDTVTLFDIAAFVKVAGDIHDLKAVIFKKLKHPAVLKTVLGLLLGFSLIASVFILNEKIKDELTVTGVFIVEPRGGNGRRLRG